VGTGGSLAGKEGTTVLGAVGAAGAADLYVEAVVVVAGFAAAAAVVDAACALGGLAQAAQMLEDEKLRYDVREELSSRKAPLRAGVAAIMWGGIFGSEVLQVDTLDRCGTPSRREVTIHARATHKVLLSFYQGSGSRTITQLYVFAKAVS
jgi:hypothetical protein